ncbi:hypothetical protein Pmar_PMAR024348, partial [Perkinsus marinus ATCC 50983]
SIPRPLHSFRTRSKRQWEDLHYAGEGDMRHIHTYSSSKSIWNFELKSSTALEEMFAGGS